MASKQKPPAVVAGLGRPETASETAARKAQGSREHRRRQTPNNLIFSLLVTVGLVAVIFLMVPRGGGDFDQRSVDVAALAAEGSPTAGATLIAPVTPEGWKAKQAELRSAGSVNYWYIGYTTADGRYAAVAQAFTTDGKPVNDTWIAQHLEQRTATGTETFGGVNWVVYDHQKQSADGSNVTFALEGHIDMTALLVYGTDSAEVIRGLAERSLDSYRTLTKGNA